MKEILKNKQIQNLSPKESTQSPQIHKCKTKSQAKQILKCTESRVDSKTITESKENPKSAESKRDLKSKTLQNLAREILKYLENLAQRF